MLHHRHRRPQPQRPGRRRKQGFSRPIARKWFDMFGIRRDQKREFFNLMSTCVVRSFALTAGVSGLMQLGWIAGAVLAGLGACFGKWFVKNDGMFR